MRAALTNAWSWLERFVDGPRASPAVFAIALANYAIVSVAFPLAAGRDLGTYLRASFELRSAEIVLPQATLGRAPVTGVVAEVLISAGPIVAELAMGLAYALSVVCWWLVARRLGAPVGVAMAGLLLVFPSYVLLFHRLSSDALYAGVFALAALLAARAIEKQTLGRCAAVGGALALLVLVRPVSQILIVLIPLAALGAGPWRARVGRVAIVGLAAILPLGAWATHNAVRADDFTVVRGSGYGLPLYRAFVVDRIVEPRNGEATRELARAVERDLLPREPYRSYGIDLAAFFSSGSARMHEDLVGLSDRTWGWGDDYAHLARVGREAVVAHPGAYARGVARDVWRLLWWPLFLPTGDGDASTERWLVASAQLPQPTEGQPIPSASVSGFITTPDGRYREVWTSPTEHAIVADDPADAEHLDRLNRRVDELYRAFSDRDGNAELGSWLNRASRWFPRPAVWLLVGLVAIAIRRPRGLLPLVLTAAAGLVIIVTALAVPATAEYSVPFVPAFMLLAVWGLIGVPRSSPGARRRSNGPGLVR